MPPLGGRGADCAAPGSAPPGRSGGRPGRDGRGGAYGAVPFGGRERDEAVRGACGGLHGADCQHQLRHAAAAVCKTRHGYRRRGGRVHCHGDPVPCAGAGDAGGIPRSGVLHAGEDRQEREAF